MTWNSKTHCQSRYSISCLLKPLISNDFIYIHWSYPVCLYLTFEYYFQNVALTMVSVRIVTDVTFIWPGSSFASYPVFVIIMFNHHRRRKYIIDYAQGSGAQCPDNKTSVTALFMTHHCTKRKSPVSTGGQSTPLIHQGYRGGSTNANSSVPSVSPTSCSQSCCLETSGPQLNI